MDGNGKRTIACNASILITNINGIKVLVPAKGQRGLHTKSRLLALPANITQGLKWLAMTNEQELIAHHHKSQL
jgi:hypothetical protein